MTDREAAFWADILANPDDLATRRIFADWLDEQGKADAAFAHRWAARRGLYPYVSRKFKSIWWGRVKRGSRGEFNLPGPVFDALRGRRRRVVKVYRNVVAAFDDLAAALASLRVMLSAE